MINEDTIKAAVEGLKRNADALLAFLCMIVSLTMMAAGVPWWGAIVSSLSFYGIYSFIRISDFKRETRKAELAFDKTKEANRLKLEQRKTKLLK
jgi:hypoxanthine-guanine phosphoribosyltransferase